MSARLRAPSQPLTDPRAWLAQHSDSGAGTSTPDGLTDPRKWLAEHSSSTPAPTAPAEDDQPGFLRTFAQDMGIPTSMDELRAASGAMKPRWSDILIPGGPAVRNYLQSA